MYHSHTLQVLFFFLCLACLRAKGETVTIDDFYGDSSTGEVPAYTSCTLGSVCTTCTSHPDAKLAYDNNWHDCNASSITFSFTGTSFSVYYITDSYFGASSKIFLDGEQVSFLNIPPTPGGKHNYTYNATLYTSGTLSDENHQVNITSMEPLMFDYAQYTRTASSSASSSSFPAASSSSSASPVSIHSRRNNGAIIGGSITAVVVALLLLVGVVLIVRRRRMRRPEESTTPEHRTFTSDFSPRQPVFVESHWHHSSVMTALSTSEPPAYPSTTVEVSATTPSSPITPVSPDGRYGSREHLNALHGMDRKSRTPASEKSTLRGSHLTSESRESGLRPLPPLPTNNEDSG